MPFATSPSSSTTTDGSACATSGHPLEMFPVFRRIPRSIARDLVYTLIWNTLFVVVFSVLNIIFVPAESLGNVLWSTFVFANCIGFLIHLEFAVGDRLFPEIHRQGMVVRAIYFLAAADCRRFRGVLARHRNSALPGHARLDLLASRDVRHRWAVAADLDAAADDFHSARARGAHGGGLRARAVARGRRGARGDAGAAQAAGSTGRAALPVQHAGQRRQPHRLESGDGEEDARPADRAVARRGLGCGRRGRRRSRRRPSTCALISS